MFYYENNLLCIAKYKRILSLTESKINIVFKNFNLSIDGVDLRIISLEEMEIKVVGEIKSITIDKVNG